MTKKIIYNCHSHIFTHENIPNGYFPFGLVPIIRFGPLRWLMRGVLKVIVPWSKNDKLHRYAAFINAAYRKKQEGNFKHLITYYPENTRFIVLPMDMSEMGAGKIKEDIDKQHAELARIYNDSRYNNILIPFAHIEPRRPDALSRLKTLVEVNDFKGVKIYPPLGYGPDYKVLMNEIYPYMVEKNIPLMVHCSPGSVNSKKISKTEAHAFADPYNYRKVMEVFPDLRICLGHFGGIGEWRRHINEPRNLDNPTGLSKILELLCSGLYPNLYTDISFTIFNFQDNIPMLKILLEDQQILDKVLFGSDFYMSETEKYSEKRLSIDLRASIGEDKFWQIANINPKKYLGF